MEGQIQTPGSLAPGQSCRLVGKGEHNTAGARVMRGARMTEARGKEKYRRGHTRWKGDGDPNSAPTTIVPLSGWTQGYSAAAIIECDVRERMTLGSGGVTWVADGIGGVWR
jgi:hypothetical protein